MRVIITQRAGAQIATRRAWWRENRPASRDLFDRELAHALGRIESAPLSSPVFTKHPGRTVRRRLLPKTRCHLCFEPQESTGEVWVVAAGGSQRKRPPRLQDAP